MSAKKYVLKKRKAILFFHPITALGAENISTKDLIKYYVHIILPCKNLSPNTNLGDTKARLTSKRKRPNKYDFTSRPLKPKPFHQGQPAGLFSPSSPGEPLAFSSPPFPRHTNQGAKNKRRATTYVARELATSSSRRPRRDDDGGRRGARARARRGRAGRTRRRAAPPEAARRRRLRRPHWPLRSRYLLLRTHIHAPLASILPLLAFLRARR